MDGTSETWPATSTAEFGVNVITALEPEGPCSPRPDLAAMDEPGLVRACLDGCPGAFDRIVTLHRRAIYQLCYRFLGNHEDATDMAQEVFLRAYRALGGFKGQSSLGTWLYRIGVNLCLNKKSSKGLQTEPLGPRDVVAAPGPDAVARLEQEERAARVRAAIARLPDKQRAALVLRVYQELSHQEIADILGSSEGAVKGNFFHALRNLRRLLEGESS
jgi:RNA polymerase sigma-70 factor (ECF subfamily)